ncbi:MAG: SRPBCC family protein [Myxococcota bacterium]
MKRAESIDIEASPDKVWAVSAEQFADIGVWSSGVTRSHALPLTSQAQVGQSLGVAGRVCETPQGETIETLTELDAASRTFTYEITGDAMPFFVKRATNTWSVTPLGPNRTRLTMSVEMQRKGLVGAVMDPMMGFGMGRVLRTNLEDLKHFIETGTQTARKAKLATA